MSIEESILFCNCPPVSESIEKAEPEGSAVG